MEPILPGNHNFLLFPQTNEKIVVTERKDKVETNGERKEGRERKRGEKREKKNCTCKSEKGETWRGGRESEREREGGGWPGSETERLGRWRERQR